MHDKQVRRRRAVLGVLVGASLVLLTAYFGESPSSPLHSVQRGIVEVLSPVQEGASKVLSPVRDVAHWFSTTLNAKSKLNAYKTENEKLTQQIAKLQQYKIDHPLAAGLETLDTDDGINAYAPVTASVYERDPSSFYRTMFVNKGSGDGIQVDDPVVGDGGLVGKVSSVGSTFSEVTLISDHSSSVTAEVQDSAGDDGELVPAVGNPSEMKLMDLPAHAQVSQGQLVVTAGFKYGKYDSIFPPDIPIGTVTGVNATDLLNNQEVSVTPYVDLQNISVVQVLTRPHGATESASLGGSGVTQTAQVSPTSTVPGG